MYCDILSESVFCIFLKKIFSPENVRLLVAFSSIKFNHPIAEGVFNCNVMGIVELEVLTAKVSSAIFAYSPENPFGKGSTLIGCVSPATCNKNSVSIAHLANSCVFINKVELG